MTLRFALGALLSLLLLTGQPAGATTMLRVDLAGLSASSDAVVHGTVRRVESQWSGDGRRIFTDVEIEVHEALKGQPGATVVVTQPGGQVGDIGQVVHGLASFTPGEEVVVFLGRVGGDGYHVSGMSQGKFEVRRAADGKSVLAVPASTGDALLLDPVTRQPSASTLRTVPLSELKANVRAAVQGGSPRPSQQRVPAKPAPERRP
ncbi:hypothetical protein P2318_22445 [Myxococcaceae bacterium GXIMD 01537]